MTIHPGGLITQTTPRSAIANWGTRDDDYRLKARHACWICGAHPARLMEITALGDSEPTYISGGWASPWLAGHEHATNPPTPEGLAAAGHAALRRILEDS
jgi:hypothetical protein